MAGIKQIYPLVKSLTKSEKRVFRLNAGKTEGDKDYLLLFDLIGKYTDEKEVRPAFQKLRPRASFNIACHYLYHNIIKSLASSENNAVIEDRLLEGLKEVKILYEKGMVRDSLRLIRTYKEIAKTNEKFLYFALYSRLELDYNTQQQFRFLNEDEVLSSQADYKRSLYQELNLMEHSSLYEVLYLRYIQKGTVKNEQEKMQLNDLLLSEMMLAENPRYHSLQGRKIHSLFQSIYFMMISDNKSSLRSYMELNELFESYPELWGDPPFHYIYHLQGILSSLRNEAHYEEMKQFIDKLKNVSTSSRSGQLMILQNKYIFGLQYFIDKLMFKEALTLVHEYEEKLLNNSTDLLLSDHATISFYASLVYYLNRDYKKATSYLKIMHTDRSLAALPVYKVMKLLNLFLLFRKHDYSLLLHEISAWKTTNREGVKISETERILLRLFKDLFRFNNEAKRRDCVNKADHALFLISTNVFEKSLIHYINFRLLIKDLISSK